MWAEFLAGIARFLPACPFHSVTGVPCPTCGATRASVLLLSGNILDAVRFNPLFVAALFFGAIYAFWAIFRYRRDGVIPNPLDPALRKPLVRWSIVALIVTNWVYLIVAGV